MNQRLAQGIFISLCVVTGFVCQSCGPAIHAVVTVFGGSSAGSSRLGSSDTNQSKKDLRDLLNAGTPATPGGTIQFSLASSTTTGEAVAHTVTVSLSAASTGATTVDVVDAGAGTAMSGTDYTPVPTTVVTIPVGMTSQTFTLTTLADAFVEGGESVNLALQNASGATLGTQSTHTVTIADDDSALVAFMAAGGPTSETGTRMVDVTLTVVGAVTLERAVTVVVTDAMTGTAGDGTDFTSVGSQVLTFMAGTGTGSRQASILITTDFIVEDDETIDLSVGSVTGPATLGAQVTHQVTITNDDMASVTIAATSTTAFEDIAGAHVVNVTITTPMGLATEATALSFNVVDLGTGTATEGMMVGVDDYMLVSPNNVSFLAGTLNGSTRDVGPVIFPDGFIDPNETIIMQLQAPSAGITISPNGDHTITILDDD